MFRIAYNKIEITQGDTASFNIDVEALPGGEKYELTDKDQVYFIVTKRKIVVPLDYIDDVTRVKFYKQGTKITILPEDTEELTPGFYYYHVRVKLRDSHYVNTIIEPSEFKINPSR